MNKKIACPLISPSLLIADDARLAARISCALVKPGHYLPVVEGPRMSRIDHDIEVVRRNNVATRAKPDTILLTGLSDISVNAITARFSPRLQSKIRRISTSAEIDGLDAKNNQPAGPPLVWGRDGIGIGLLRALRARVSIIFEDRPSPVDFVPSKGPHLVVCEDGNDIAQIIAANYAYALRAGLCIIPEPMTNRQRRCWKTFMLCTKTLNGAAHQPRLWSG